MKFNEWISEKPHFTEECLVICANEINGAWEYNLYQVKKVYYDHLWYFGWLTSDGEEYGDLNDMCAQKYLLLSPLLY